MSDIPEMDRINKIFSTSYFVGSTVKYDGQKDNPEFGEVIGARHGRIVVRMSDKRDVKVRLYHPTWKMKEVKQ
jgi:hypothetical protein